MKKNRYKTEIKLLLVIIITCFLIFSANLSITACQLTYNHENQSDISTDEKEFIDIHPKDVWNLTSNLSNGLQIPIDVRTDFEWKVERIDTPFPEDPRHHILTDLEDLEYLNQFIETYNGTDLIMYCKSGGRSQNAAIILVENNFNGTVYNMMGGITMWKNNGLPTDIGNYPPEIPRILGPDKCIINKSFNYSANATDYEENPVRYGFDWNHDNIIDDWTEFNIPGESMKLSKIWDEAGTYEIRAITEDRVGNLSNFSESMTVTVESEDIFPPELSIIKPEKGIYINDKRVLPFLTTIIFGDTEIEVAAFDIQTGLKNVSLYINDQSVSSLTDEPFNWSLNSYGFGRYKIKVLATDNAENQKEENIIAWKIL